ncbi:MAG: hydroxymethylpyrimidine/phosphomethylpyrimidine kinase [Candidatus Pedobacter colombiensis]|uniref:hydroxymethylpyrimidine kinase n=1 Tax=Candidatus Pedobacter colombiensis TaxID=3121371 RepID=A0AAJ5W5H8_9SPHI|nr:hydroxymethylpyrimidine/phosphomethylpyrimidine kinase [Pedobacter sp.]WEK17488.1 MAG: hydroxymethylpyrimidine/phosphomethylpyrimidine kinase [Pedobacter sp.]
MTSIKESRPYILSLAGFDPSAGAGVLADVKCFEQHEVYGFGVCTALTVQTDSDFIKNDWLDATQIIDQLAPLLTKFPVTACKIGLIKDIPVLLEVMAYIKLYAPTMKIVLDPVLKASSGYGFHDWEDSLKMLSPALSQIDLITPNYPEMLSMGGKAEVHAAATTWATHCPVLLKGGHQQANMGTDYLFEYDIVHELKPGVSEIQQKHGSGCVLSASVTAYLAKGFTLLNACTLAKQYIEQFLNSNNTLLGYHKL